MNGWICGHIDRQVSGQVGLRDKLERKHEMSRLMNGWICGHKDQQMIGPVGLCGKPGRQHISKQVGSFPGRSVGKQTSRRKDR